MERIKIYGVNTFYFEDMDGKYIRHRCHGFFGKKEDAIKCIKENWGDIYECGYYNVALVESVDEGLYGITETKERDWFRAEHSDGEYIVVDIDCPKQYTNIVGFTLG